MRPSIEQLPPSAVAMRYFQDGEGLDANPYPEGSDKHREFALEMHRHQAREFRDQQSQLRTGA